MVNYAVNLSDMTQEQRQAIEEDKKRWFRARKLTLTKRSPEIRMWLDSIDDPDYRSDMARRLNQMRGKPK